MAQQNEQSHSLDPATAPAKRKRGRPRKEDNPGSEPSGGVGRTRRRSNPPPPTATGHDLLGKRVSGVLDGVFDAGFLITVRVSNNGPLMKGMVFDSRISVPITAANDVAPLINMSKPNEIPILAEPLQRRDPLVPKEAVKVAGDQMQGLAGVSLDYTSKEEKLEGDSGGNLEILQEIKTNPVGNGSTQMPSGDNSG